MKENTIITLLLILIFAVVYVGWNIEKSIREVGYALCQVERLTVEDNPDVRETSKNAIATLICVPSLLGKFGK